MPDPRHIDCAEQCEIPDGTQLEEVPRPRHAWSDVLNCPNEGCGKSFLIAEEPRDFEPTREIGVWLPTCPSGRHTAHPGSTCETEDRVAEAAKRAADAVVKAFDAAFRGPNRKARP